jgi:hypothetical protein
LQSNKLTGFSGVFRTSIGTRAGCCSALAAGMKAAVVTADIRRADGKVHWSGMG